MHIFLNYYIQVMLSVLTKFPIYTWSTCNGEWFRALVWQETKTIMRFIKGNLLAKLFTG